MSSESRSPLARGLCIDGSEEWECPDTRWYGCCAIDPCDIGFCPRGFNLKKASTSPAPLLMNLPTEIPSEVAPTSIISDLPTEVTLFPTPLSKSVDTPGGKAKSASETNTMTTMTDSGITHTIPNNSVVTVIMHTTITTRRPSPTASATGSALVTNGSGGTSIIASAGPLTAPKPMISAGPNPDADVDQGLSTAAIVGVAIGGAVLIVILAIVGGVVRRRRQSRRDDVSEVFSGGFNEEDGAGGRGGIPEEKHYPPPVSTHTTGTQGSSDPFAPFGGRADDPYRPPSGTFEMDGTSVAPVELPVHDHGRGSGLNHAANGKPTSPAPRLDPVQERSDTPTNPRANLNVVQTEGGKPAYINHWNQYKNLGQADQS